MKLLSILAVAVGGSLLALLIMLLIKAQASKEGVATGLVNGQLSACSPKPNCVNSEADSGADKWVAPLTYAGSADAAWQRLQQVIQAQGGVLVRVDGDYLAATFSSNLFGFVDDFEARLDAAQGVIQLRSASRVGQSDLGANRTRVAQLRQRFSAP